LPLLDARKRGQLAHFDISTHFSRVFCISTCPTHLGHLLTTWATANPYNGNTMPLVVALLTIAVAYLIGAVPFGFLVARAKGVNIFEHGSGNIGATNVGRVLGRRLGMLVFVLDFLKGAGPVAAALGLKTLFEEPLWTGGYVEVAAGLAAFLGHIFPVYLRFRGGKGIAAGFGAVLVLVPIPSLIALAVCLVLLCATRYMSLAAICGVVVLCIAHLLSPGSLDWRNPRTWFVVVAGMIAIVKHHANIGRLLKGTENQLKENFLMTQLAKSLHVLALGLWFGSAIFFTFVVAFSLFDSFEKQAVQDKRESWFPRPAMYANADEVKEQGTRAAGYAITPMFVWYFALQGACGFIALATAFAFLSYPGSVHRWRLNFLIAAVALVVIGWPLERRVHALREPRNQTMEAYLRDRDNNAKIAAKNEARAEFGQWHGYSIIVNLACILCLTAAMALAGNLPASKQTEVSDAEPQIQNSPPESAPESEPRIQGAPSDTGIQVK
jgi:acyl-phosphate glycerol 3-phosphate acyltransferase